jgi:hypothetical protein
MPLPIEELAMKHLQRHPNDKSLYIYSKMVQTYGRQKSLTTLEALTETLEVTGMNISFTPNHRIAIEVSGYIDSFHGLKKDIYKYAHIA